MARIRCAGSRSRRSGFRGGGAAAQLTRAAEEVHLTQSAVSREIRSLEERLGTRLFERAKGGLRLTRAGLDLRDDVAAALATMRRGIERVTGPASRRSFVVVTNRSMLSDWLWARVADYTNRHPDIDLRLAPAPRTAPRARSAGSRTSTRPTLTSAFACSRGRPPTGAGSA